MGLTLVGVDVSARNNRHGITSSGLGEPPRYATTFEIDLYALGFSVPLDKRFAAVDVKRGEDGELPRVSVRGPKGQWTIDGGETVLHRKGETPEWLRTVLEYVGVDEIVEGR